MADPRNSGPVPFGLHIRYGCACTYVWLIFGRMLNIVTSTQVLAGVTTRCRLRPSDRPSDETLYLQLVWFRCRWIAGKERPFCRYPHAALWLSALSNAQSKLVYTVCLFPLFDICKSYSILRILHRVQKKEASSFYTISLAFFNRFS